MKIKLTPKNMMNQVYKFYKEHLTPRQPGRKPPNFRHCLMWALATGDYSLDWQFQFQKQISWSAAEATWAIMLNPRKALAMRPRTPSLESNVSMTESERRREASRRRARYVLDDEAEDDDDELASGNSSESSS